MEESNARQMRSVQLSKGTPGGDVEGPEGQMSGISVDMQRRVGHSQVPEDGIALCLGEFAVPTTTPSTLTTEQIDNGTSYISIFLS